jgi:sterol desaturase/sphingolipid hydroxylase (fatty acid hydroxylase superfamily)
VLGLVTGAYVAFRSSTLVALFTLWARKTRFAQRRVVFAVDKDKTQTRRELLGAAQVLLFDGAFVAFYSGSGLFNAAPPTVFNVVATLVGLFVWVEVGYYFLHRLMHHPRFFFIHKRHHEALVVQPLTFICFSLQERFLHGVLAGGSAMLASHFLPVPLEGTMAYSVVFVLLDLLGHLNVEVFPSWFARSWLGRVIYTPTFHALHHARFRGHYGLFTTFMDRIFGTWFPDYERIQADAAEGRPMRSLSERRLAPAGV